MKLSHRLTESILYTFTEVLSTINVIILRIIYALFYKNFIH